MSTYVRFETPYHCASSSQPLGIFWAASEVKRRPELCGWTRAWLSESLGWFAENLPVPHIDEHDWRAIFWFRPRSVVVREIWQLVAILREEDVAVHLRYTRLPGRIVYHDDFQIAAIPYSHGRRPRKRRLPTLV